MRTHLRTEMIRLSKVEHLEGFEIREPLSLLIECSHEFVGSSGTVAEYDVIPAADTTRDSFVRTDDTR